MLIKDFYTVVGKTEIENGKVYSIKLNPDHDVYKGHFPQRPITPGVCNILMIKELALDLLGEDSNLRLSKIDKCRLPAMVTPNGTPELDVKIVLDKSAEQIKLSAEIFKGETKYMTLSGSLQ